MARELSWPQRQPAWAESRFHPAWCRLRLLAKRAMDLILSSAALLLAWPLLLLIAVLIKLDSPGPVIFVQRRVGARWRTHGLTSEWEIGTFDFYKFRTMTHRCDASLHQAFITAFVAGAQPGPQAGVEPYKLRNDPRITRLGRWLRKSSLDELPQLFNVLKGEMSLVGPRPPIPYEVEMYQPWHRRRLAAKPGLTGLWQVAARSSVDFDEMVRLDLWYIEHQSLWLDIVILFKTPWAVLTGRGAA
jgi:lipopolysaccharide/colanic/teichoic acid biosynthesis glycosyltransferase